MVSRLVSLTGTFDTTTRLVRLTGTFDTGSLNVIDHYSDLCTTTPDYFIRSLTRRPGGFFHSLTAFNEKAETILKQCSHMISKEI